METPALVVLIYVALFTCSIAGAQEDSIAVVTTGEVLVLDCLVDSPNGDLDHEVVWLLDDVQVSNASRLVLPHLNQSHHGSNVTCSYGTGAVHTRIIHFHHKMVFEIGTTLQLNCTTNPNAATSIIWHHSNETATPDWIITDLDNVTSQLMIPSVMLDDTGLYSCVSSEGVTIKVFNVTIGLFPQEPSSINCSGCNRFEFTCEWEEIPDTHLPIVVTFQFKRAYTDSWNDCKTQGNACHFNDVLESIEFRLNITNALGRRSVDVPRYHPGIDYTVPPPHILGVEPKSTHQLDIRWTISLCGDDGKRPYEFKYQMSYTDGYTEDTNSVPVNYKTQDVMVVENANTEYCFQLKARSYGAWGEWSELVCNRTLPTVPNVDFQDADFVELDNEEREDQRDIELTWKLVKTADEPFQGVSHFELEVRQNETTVNGTDGNTTSSSSLIFIKDLKGRNDYSLKENVFSHTIPGLEKYQDYTITLSAVNSAGRSKTMLKVGAWTKVAPVNRLVSASSAPVIAGVCVPLVILLILALLAFGFQRLKNNSRPLPNPVFHGIGNVKPTHVEHEVFDELPSVTREKQRQQLVSISRELADSQIEKEYRTSSSSSSGVGSDTSSSDMKVVEKVPLLQTQNLSGSIDKSPYSLLSEITPSMPHLQMAPDAVETDLDSLSPTGGHFSSTDEGISTEGSSFYNKLGSARDSSPLDLYYSMCSQVPGRVTEPFSDSGYMADGSQQFSGVGDDDCLLRANDADDESSQPRTPATPNRAYYSYLSSSPTDTTCRDNSHGYCDPYVVAAARSSSPPLRVPLESLATIEESPSHYVPQAAPGVLNCNNGSQLPCNSGYVDSTDICMGRPTGIHDDFSSGSNPSSSQSSPEHAIIIHKNPRRNVDDFSGENMDNTYFSHPSSTALDNSSLPTSAVIDTSVPSQAISSSRAPQGNGYVVSPPPSNSPNTRPKGSTGYVTCAQLSQAQIPAPIEDTHQASEQPTQNLAHIGTVLPTFRKNADGYVPVSQMPVQAENARVPSDTPAPTQAPQTTSGSSDLGTPMHQLLPACDVSNEPTDVEQEPLDSDHQQKIPSGYQPLEEIPTPKPESVQEPPLSNKSKDKAPEDCNGSMASCASPDRHKKSPCINGGYVSKDMTNFPARTEPSLQLQLNNNGYVCIP